MRLTKTCFHDMPNGGTAKRNRAKSGNASDLRGGGGGEAQQKPETPEVFKPTDLSNQEIDQLKPVKREIEIPAYMSHLPPSTVTADILDNKIAIVGDGPTYAKYQLRGIVNSTETSSLMMRDPSDKNGRYLGGYKTKREALAASKALLKARIDWSNKQPREVRDEVISVLQRF